MDQRQARKEFDRLVWPHSADVLRLAQLLTGNHADANDLAQDALLKAFGAIGNLRPGSDVRAWLMVILRHAHIDRLRGGKRQAGQVSLDRAELDVADDGPSPSQQVEEAWKNPQELLERFSDQQMIDALQQLPQEIRWTILLVDVQQMDMEQAAGLLEIPVGTVKSRLHRGRGMLRRALLTVGREMGLA